IPLGIGATAFTSSNWYTNAIGGRISSHQAQNTSLSIADTAYGITNGVSAFEVVNERYMHENLDANNTVLLASESGEPYAWVRDAGKGRVFYTALGREETTWKNLNYLRLV